MSKTDSQDCIFCKIVSNEVPSSKIYEDDEVVAFLDLRPSSKGHALVVPRQHSADFLESSDQLLVKIVPKVRKIAEGIMKATGAAGFNLTVNNGAAAGQVIFHLHFHIIPRYSNDGLKLFPQHDSEFKTRNELAEHIKKQIAQ
jgi:histidine triad (HIT) family protein